ncbi:VOC family protein [Rhizorhabdus wittichii]|uniref:VOC family protein n=1 Tax=Rhizorhabdus wittichii TaxID=160791 RepID=A0A975HD95_9SPHN|nr:VOC family protein [Rhizorhabdus wittichii]QTH21181.1 VOC family protein [Rhizorhabdus wittichii]
MRQMINMVMIGIEDIKAVRGFYEDGLGWAAWRTGGSGSVMYRTGGVVLVFLDAAYLAAERGVAVPRGGATSLASFVASRDEVDDALSRAAAAGAVVTSPPRDRDGGLYSGYFDDPQGLSWEVVWSPDMAPAEDSSLAAGG